MSDGIDRVPGSSETVAPGAVIRRSWWLRRRRLRVGSHGAWLVLLGFTAVACDSRLVEPDSAPSEPAGIWTASGDPPGLLRLSPLQLRDSGDVTPATSVTTQSASLESLLGLAFASDGTLWVASPDDSALLAFSPGSLSASGSKAAATVIKGSHGSLLAPIGLAFDAAHGLWVADHDAGTLVRYTPAQLAAGGRPVPAVVVSGVGNPTSVAFDAAGALWVSDNLRHTIARYDARLLAKSGSPPPAVVLTPTGHCFVNPSGLAFDAVGRLWVASLGCREIVAFVPSQLRTTGSPAPTVVLASSGFSLVSPVGLAFDSAGDLWVAGAGGLLTEFSRESLAASGAPAPGARLTLSGRSLLWSLAFWPRPTGLPLH